MKITTEQLKGLSCLFTKEDKEELSSLTGLKYLSIKAILRGERFNDNVEFLILKKAKEKCERLRLILEQIEK